MSRRSHGTNSGAEPDAACYLPHQRFAGSGIDVEEGDARLLGREGAHEGGADAAGSSGDQYGAISEAGVARTVRQ